jgi:hypothetical protein
MSQGRDDSREINASQKTYEQGADSSSTPQASTSSGMKNSSKGAQYNNLGGSSDIPAESATLPLVPVAVSQGQKLEWNEKLLKEVETRIVHRKWLFRLLSVFTLVLFSAFLYYLFWANNHPYRYVDHMVLWLLAAMPMGSVFILVKLSNEPAEADKPAPLMWPEEALKIANKFVDVVADVVKDKLKAGSGKP